MAVEGVRQEEDDSGKFRGRLWEDFVTAVG